MERFRLVSTSWGWFTVVARGGRVAGTRLPVESKADCLEEVRGNFPDAEYDERLLPEFCRAVQAYFQGKCRTLTVALAAAEGSAFERAVRRACRQIPYGKTCSYGELARRAGYAGAARAVGSVMRKNQVPLIVPCHRVIASDGGLGGFSSPGGCGMKARLLELERGRDSLA